MSPSNGCHMQAILLLIQHTIILTRVYSKWVACVVKGEGCCCKTSLHNFRCQLCSTGHLVFNSLDVGGTFPMLVGVLQSVTLTRLM